MSARVLRPARCIAVDAMPKKKHLRGATDKEQRQYEHIKEDAEESGRYGARAKEVAARTVMKQRGRKKTKKGAKKSAAKGGRKKTASRAGKATKKTGRKAKGRRKKSRS